MGDSILTSLSLPPSGKMASNQTGEGLKYSTDPSHHRQHKSPFIEPVFGTISNKDVPIMVAKCKEAALADALITAELCTSTSRTVCGLKRRQPDMSDSEEAGEVLDVVANEKKEKSGRMEDSARGLMEDSCGENQEDGARVISREQRFGADIKVDPNHLGVKQSQSPSTFLSCLYNKPRVVLRRLSLTTRGGTSALSQASSQHPKSDVDLSNSRNKE